MQSRNKSTNNQRHQKEVVTALKFLRGLYLSSVPELGNSSKSQMMKFIKEHVLQDHLRDIDEHSDIVLYAWAKFLVTHLLQIGWGNFYVTYFSHKQVAATYYDCYVLLGVLNPPRRAERCYQEICNPDWIKHDWFCKSEYKGTIAFRASRKVEPESQNHLWLPTFNQTDVDQ